MTYQTLAEYNSTGMAGMLTYVADTVDIFIPGLLLVLFGVTLLGTYFAQKRSEGRGNFLASFAVASYFTAIISYFMMLIPGLIDNITLAITTTFAIVATIILFISKD